ncbi:hypothetical protein [Mucilaginibacter sp. FT3.2]|uniref:hypothetical protein n=1 Tax=Mucilaginibacter sp. FT3.2 TaxID=2723090 RepID=UPI00161181CA|nr:hypothetical protein [Mucilaginibacter sp. FT3.2]MBB6233971.1 hypothetical protein [Mucilaginibacter sp. FT3.2]
MSNYYLLILFALTSCNHKSKRNYKYTIAKDNHLYIQIYRTSILGSSVEAYLTDSITFSQKLGTYDDETSYIDCKMKGDTIITETKEYLYGASQQPDTMKIVAAKTYSLKALKRLHNFK